MATSEKVTTIITILIGVAFLTLIFSIFYYTLKYESDTTYNIYDENFNYIANCEDIHCGYADCVAYYCDNGLNMIMDGKSYKEVKK